MILAFETATNICSVCFQGQDGLIHEKRTERKGSHSELLFLYVKELMQEHSFVMKDIKAVLVSTGPGSYTGLRIAASAIKGMLFGLNTEVFAGNTLAGFAQAAGKGRVHSVINARRKHLYHQEFWNEKELKQETEAEILELEAIEALLKPGDKIIGSGMERLSEKSLQGVELLKPEMISAKGLIHLFESNARHDFFAKTDAENLESNYLTSSQVNNTSL